MTTVISVENLSKTYRLGQIGTGTFTHDLNLWWAKMRGKPNPMLKIGEKDHGQREGEELWALKDVSFKVQQGEVLGIIGRNGAGKSTLLKILSRVTAPTSGRIRVKGRIASLLEVGTGFHPDLTGRENIHLNGAILGMTKNEVTRKFDEIVDFAEVEKFIDTPVKRYSSGMYVRLAFAVAAHLDPEILVVDEVLAVGDAEFQKKCLGKMGEVAKGGRTVLFVSHNMGAISHLCTRSMWVDRGCIKSSGITPEIISQYLLADSMETGFHKWSNGHSQPDVNEFKFLEICVTNQRGEVTSHLNIQEPFKIEIKYKLFQELPYARVGIILKDGLGNIVIEAYDSDEIRYAGIRTPGVYTISCEIPGNLLNEQRYFISAHAGIPNAKYLAGAEDLLSIDMYSAEQVNAYLHVRREGIIRPILKWEQIRL